MLYTFTTIPQYDAVAQLLIESENPNVVKFEEVLQQNKETDDYYQTQYRILQSRLLARRTIETEKLWEHPQLLPPPAPQGIQLNPIYWVKLGLKSVRSLFPSNKPVLPPDASETAAQSGMIDAFLGNLTITPVRNSRLVDVKYRSSDPQFAMRIANALSEQYIEQNLEFKFLATQQATQFLNQRMTEQRRALEQNEMALQKYREQTDSVSLEDRQNIVVQRLADLNAAVTKARTERIQKEAAWNQIRAIQTDRAALDTHPLVLTNTFIQQLKGEVAQLQQNQAQLGERLGEKHPEMVKVKSALTNAEAKLQGELAKVVQSIRNDYESALAQERSLSAALEQQKNEALTLNRQSIQYGVLQRDATSSRQLFEGLLQRSKETGIEGELRTSNIRVVDKAELPQSPATPRTMNNIALSLLSGLLLGIGLAFFFDYLDNRIKSPEEIKTHLGIPFLGLVPALRNSEVPGSPLVSNGVTRQFGEAFRTIRTNVLFSSAQEGCRSVVVTSTLPGEGKSIVASNLALSLAMAGQRALLIDGDMRRPKVHMLFGLSQEPGLSNVIVGSAQASETLKRTTVPNLWIMVAGKQPPNPAELLGSRRFKDLMTSLTPHFDWIVIDSPPVMAVTDASIVSHLVHGVVFVVGCEMTGRTAARTALDQLDSAKAKYLGAVLNRVDLRRHSYYYSHYYKRAYSEYYAGAPEATA
jgi:polysaccharide biosynthesis transport protein